MDRRTRITSTRRSSTVRSDPARVWAVVAGAGSRDRAEGLWYVDALPLRFRAGLDRALGGSGARWPVPGRPTLRAGDTAGFWRVTRADGSRLDLEASLRAPGLVRLSTRLDPLAAGATRVSQQVSFTPSGPAGVAYLVADLPAREVVMELVHRRLLDALRAIR